VPLWGRFEAAVIDAKGNNAVVNRYYGDGSLKEVEDAEGNITKYEYNGFKGLKKTIYEDETYEQVTYDQYRRVSQTRGRGGQMIEFTYDNLNRVTKKETHDPNQTPIETITYEYDLAGRLYRVRRIDMRSATRPKDHEPAGRLFTFVLPGTLSPDPWDFPLWARGRIKRRRRR
jgi:YD repeat-containing protein